MRPAGSLRSGARHSTPSSALVSRLRSLLLLVATVAAASAGAQAGRPPRIAYRIAMPEPAAHLYEIEMDVNGGTGVSLALQLPVWSPGRYAKMDFAKNIQDFRVTDAAGTPLPWTKSDGARW